MDYWSVLNDGIKRGGTGGLVAVNSKLGWLLSGQWYNERGTVSTQSAIMTEVKKLGSQVERFWDLDTIGIKEKEISVSDKLLDDVKFVNGRYEVKLPFKEDHHLIEDNYALAFARLKGL